MTSPGQAAASAPGVGHRSSQASQHGITRSTWVCCSITSDTRIAYGSRVWRQGRSRPFSAYQSSKAASIEARVDWIPMARTRFAPSPTGSLHLGSALSAVANRRRGDWFLLRIDDTDRARDVEGAVEEILADLEWIGVTWNEGPARQSERAERHREAASAVGVQDEDGALR